MSTIHWSSRYETGIPAIDQEHRRLFEAMNELIAAFRRGDPRPEVRKVVDLLVNYTMEHLQTEEDWMRDHSFPGLEAHRLEHEAMKTTVLGLVQQFEAGEDLTMKVTVLMADWLQYHLDGSDLALAEHSRALAEETAR